MGNRFGGRTNDDALHLKTVYRRTAYDKSPSRLLKLQIAEMHNDARNNSSEKAGGALFALAETREVDTILIVSSNGYSVPSALALAHI